MHVLSTFHRKVGLKHAGPQEYKGVGFVRTQDGKALHKEAEMDTAR